MQFAGPNPALIQQQPAMKENVHTLTDQDLLQRLRQDDEGAFAELHRRFARLLLDVAYQRLQDQDVTEEIVQDLFVTLWLRRRELLIHGAVKAYLLTALRNRVIDHFRYLARQVELDHLGEDALPVNPTEETVFFHELKTAYERELSRLPERCRAAAELYRQGKSVAEIGEALGMGPKTVESHLLKANRTLRDHLKDYALLAVLVLNAV